MKQELQGPGWRSLSEPWRAWPGSLTGGTAAVDWGAWSSAHYLIHTQEWGCTLWVENTSQDHVKLVSCQLENLSEMLCFWWLMFLVIIVDSFCPVLFGKKSLSPVGKQAIHYQSFSTCYDVWFKAMMALTKSMRLSWRCKDLIVWPTGQS